jgi:GAF domain-containing protein
MLTDPTEERPAGRRWTPTDERVATMATISELFADQRSTREDAIAAAAAAVSRCVGEAIVIYLLSEDRRWMLPAGTSDPEPAIDALLGGMVGNRYSAEEGFTACAIDQRSTVLVPRVTAEEIAALQPGLVEICQAMGMTGFILSPVLVRGECIALIAQGRTTNAAQLTDDDARFLEDVARVLAIGIAAWPAGR